MDIDITIQDITAEYEELLQAKILQIIALKKENEQLVKVIELNGIEQSDLSLEAQKIAREAKRVIDSQF